MSFQSEPGVIQWRLHFDSPPERMLDAPATAAGRATYLSIPGVRLR
jgi:hypothetical protein